MWVNSKTAAAALGVGYETLKKAIQRVQKKEQNFLSINKTNMSYRYSFGIGGASGKVLELDVPDALLAAAGLLEGLLKEKGNGISGSGDDFDCDEVVSKEKGNGYGIGNSSNTGAGYGAGELVDGRSGASVQSGYVADGTGVQGRGTGSAASATETSGRELVANNELHARNGGCELATDRSLGCAGCDYRSACENSVERGGSLRDLASNREGENAIGPVGGFNQSQSWTGGIRNERIFGLVGSDVEHIRTKRIDSDRNVGGNRVANVVGLQAAAEVVMTKEVKTIIGSTNLDVTRAQAVREALAVPAGIKKMTHYESVAAKYDASVSSLLRWVALASAKAPEIATNEANVYGIKLRVRAFDAHAIEWAVGFKLNNLASTIGEIYSALQQEATKQNWRVGSEKRLYQVFAQSDISLMIKAKAEGARGIRNSAVAYTRRRFDSWDALEMVVGDQIVADYDVVNPDTGEIVTPELYVFADMHSRKIVGVAVKLGKYNSHLIGQAFKQVCEIGIPQQVYTDNGKPELSKYFLKMQAQIKGIDIITGDSKVLSNEDGECALLESELDRREIGHVKAGVKNSRAKPIEMIFGHLQRKLHFITNGVGFHKRVNGDVGDMQAKQLKKDTKSGALMLAQDWVKCFIDAVEWWNNHEFKVNDERNGKSPNQLFEASLLRTGVVRLTHDALVMATMPVELRKVSNGGVKVGGFSYNNPRLVNLYGQRIPVYSDPSDIDKVYALDGREVLLCQIHKAIDAKDYAAVSESIASNNAATKAVMAECKRLSMVYTGVKTVTKISKMDAVAKKVNAAKSNEAELRSITLNDNDIISKVTENMKLKKAVGG